MASLQQRLHENVPGDFFVDSTCIDCDTCSQLAPGIFRDHGDQCSVHHQPANTDETRQAMMALVACPTGSIGSTEKHDPHIGIDAFPFQLAENLYFCGFTSEDSFGAWSYLIMRPADQAGSAKRNALTAFRSVAWYSWPEQIRSMEKLLHYQFEWVLPGHGEIHHTDAQTMRRQLEECIVWMKTRI